MDQPNQNPETPESNKSLFSNQEGGDGGTAQPEEKGVKLDQEQLSQILKQNSNAQSHIKTIETENKTLREQVQELQEQLNNSASFQDLLDGLGNQGTSSNEPGPTASPLDTDQLRSQIKEEVLGDIANAQTELARQSNLQEAITLAKKTFGDSYEDKLRKAGEDVGLSEADITTLAMTSPKAFAKLVGADHAPKGSSIPTTSSFSTTPSPNAGYDFAKIAQLKKYDTEEGRAANRMWQSAEFQQAYREHILKQKD